MTVWVEFDTITIIAMAAQLKPLVFVGSANRELRAFPQTVIHEIGLTLLRVQYGDHPP